MSREFPDWISPIRAAEGKRIFSGSIPLQRMKRLAELLVEANGVATFEAAFKADIENRVVIDLQVEADLPLICQASLDIYHEKVKRHSELCVVEPGNKQVELPDQYEPVQTENGRLAIASLVEDELLLALPQIPRKPGLQKVEFSTGGQTFKSMDPQAVAKKKPFADLQNILKRDKQN